MTTTSVPIVDDILKTNQGREWYRWWVDGVIEDKMLIKKYGREGLELFHATGAVSQEIDDSRPDQAPAGMG